LYSDGTCDFILHTLPHHSELARFTNEIEKAAREISWDAVRDIEVWDLIQGLPFLDDIVGTLKGVLSLPVSPHLQVIRVTFDQFILRI